MKKYLISVILSLGLLTSFSPVSIVQAKNLQNTNTINSTINVQAKIKNLQQTSFTYDNKKLPENLKALIPKGLEAKAVVKHIGKVDIIFLPQGEDFTSTQNETNTSSTYSTNSTFSANYVPSNGGIQYQNYDSSYQVLVRGIEDHNDGYGPHFNINTQTRGGRDLHDYHITYNGKAWFSDEYTWDVKDNIRNFSAKVVGYGEEAEASEQAAWGILSEIAETDGPEIESLAAGGASVIGELLLGLLLL